MLVCAKNKEEEFSYVNGIWNILLENKLGVKQVLQVFFYLKKQSLL